MTTEKQSSYFLRTQSTILNGENNINTNPIRFNIIGNKCRSNKKYLSAGNNRKMNKKYISKDKKQKNKKITKKKYAGIDLEKVSGSSHINNSKNKNLKYNNKIPVRKSLNYYEYLTKKNKKEEEKNINNDNEQIEKVIYKPNNYSPFHQIIINIRDKNKNNNYIPRNNDYNLNKFLINSHPNRYNTNPTKQKNSSKFEENNKNNQYFSSYRKNIKEKIITTNNINNNPNQIAHVNTYLYNDNSNNNNESKFTYTYNTNQINNNKYLYLNENINDNEIISRRIVLMNQIKNITKTNPYINNNKEEEINKTNINKNINKSYSLNSYNNNCNNNAIYTPLPYKSFLKSIFDQNYTNKFVNDFNKNSSHNKHSNNTFDYNKNKRSNMISKGFFEFDDDENKLKKMLENIPRHLKEKNKNEIHFVNNLNENKRNKKNKSTENKKNMFKQINYVMPPNKLINKIDNKK